VVGYHRYDTPTELLLLNRIWVPQSLMTNCFLPQQKLISKVRDGAKVTKKYDRPTTPQRRATAHERVTIQDKAIMKDTLDQANPAAIQRQIHSLVEGLFAPLQRRPWQAGGGIQGYQSCLRLRVAGLSLLTLPRTR
jgi:hypothetical protein